MCVCIVSVCVLVKIYLGRGTYVCEILDTWRWFGREGGEGFIPIIWVLVRVSRGGVSYLMLLLVFLILTGDT